MDNPLISIIVPVYNVKEYLKRCVESLINQTYRNIEIIIVDDGSTDGSELLCDNFKNTDKRIKVFHKKNGGLSDARNFGISHSTGQYIGFVDSDDFIDKNMYEILMKNIIKNDADISICKFTITNKNSFKIKPETDIKVFSKEEAMKEVMLGNYFQSHVCNKLFKRKLFSNLKFPEKKWYEDVYSMHLLIHNSEKIVSSNYCGYAYFRRKESITNCTWNNKHFDWLDALENIKRFYKINYPEYLDEVCNVYVFANLLLIRKLCLTKKSGKKLIELLRENILENYKKYIKYKGKTSYNTTRNKIEVFFIKHFPKFYKIIVLILKNNSYK